MNRSKHNINFLPEDFQSYILDKVKSEGIHFRLASPRKSKLGDYRYNYQHQTHAISINIDLTEIQFLVTFIHELAHKKCYDLFKGKVDSHGKEWKQIFVNLLNEAKASLLFKEEWLKVIDATIEKPMATATSMDVEEDGLKVSDLSPNVKFELSSGRKFQLIKKRRTRFLCTDLSNGKLYAVSANAIVVRTL